MELKDYFLPLRRWWWLIAAAVLVATLSSFIATRSQPFNYSAKAALMVGRSIQSTNPQDYEINASQQLGTTYANLAVRRTVRTATQAALGLAWLPEYKARMVEGTQLLEITVIDTDPARAQAVANEVANQLILQTPSEERDLLQRREYISKELQALEVMMDETKAEIQKLRDDLANMFSARQIADTESQIAGLEQKLRSYQSGYWEALQFVQGGVNTLQVVEPADLPTSPIGPNKGFTVVLATLIGLVLSSAAAYLMEYLDDTLKNPDDVRKALDLTTLGGVPEIKGPEGSAPLLGSMDAQSGAAEAYRVVRTNLQFAAVDRPLRTLMVTSPLPSEGKSVTAGNLAAALAQAGKRVVLVDADLHRPRQHRLFGLRNNIGLTTALLEEKPTVDGLLQGTNVPGLSVLTTGPLPPNPAELLGSGRMGELIDALAGQADVVVFDTPPVMALTDAAVVAHQVDGVLLVISAGVTRREPAQRALAALNHVNARVLGALVNRVQVRAGDYYHYYRYGDYYSGGNGDAGTRTNGKGGRYGGRFGSRVRGLAAQAGLGRKPGG